MKRLRICFAALSLGLCADAVAEGLHPSEYVRVLEAGSPLEWGAAIDGLLGDDDELSKYAVSSVVRRVTFLDAGRRARVARALGDYGHTLPTLLNLAHEDPDEHVRRVAMDSILALRSPGSMDAHAGLIVSGNPHRLAALTALVATFSMWAERISDGTVHGEIDPVMAPSNGAPDEIFDRRYLVAVTALLSSEDPSERAAALRDTSRLNSAGLRAAWRQRLDDPEPSIRTDALWTLARKGDAATCEALETALTEEDDVTRAGEACASTRFIHYFEQYAAGNDPQLYRLLIDGGMNVELMTQPAMVDAMRTYADHPEPFLRETATTLLGWYESSLADEEDGLEASVAPIVLTVGAFVSFILGALFFVWAFRLFFLFVRVRRRPTSRIRSMPMGPVAVEGKIQPASGLLRHPLTDEPCVYYAGADVDHPNVRFYVMDDTGRALVDPRGAVLFSDDSVLVTDEQVHLVGFADKAYGNVMIGKDESAPPLYRRVAHRAIEALFGLGRRTSVTKMLFTDPARCFWIWDDLERRPMGEASDVLWLAASVLLAGAWIVVFAVSVLGIVDQEMSAQLARALATLE